MSQFDAMDVQEREPFNYFLVRQQNKALQAAMEQKQRRIKELSKALQRKEREHNAAVSMISCVDRHWKQLESDARLLLTALGKEQVVTNGAETSPSSSEDQSLLNDILLHGADKSLLADLSKVAESVAVDPLDEVIRYDDENAESWGHEGVDEYDPSEDEGELESVDRAIQQKCEVARSVLQRLAKVLDSRSSSLEASQPNDGQTPPKFAAELAEGNRRLQAQIQLFKDRLIVARKCQANLYRGLIRALKDRHRLLRPLDWGQGPGHGPEGGVKSEAGDSPNIHEGSNGVCGHSSTSGGTCHHGDSKATGHKRKRSEGSTVCGGDHHHHHERGDEEARDTIQELKELAEKRVEELDRLREEKAAMVRRITALSEPPKPVSDEQLRASVGYRQAVSEAEAATRERNEANRRCTDLTREVAELKGKMALVVRSKQEAIEAERAHFMSRIEEMTRDNHALRRQLDEYAVEVEAKQELVRQADEMKGLLDDQKGEVVGLRDICRRQGDEVTELRSQWQSLQERLAAREAEVEQMSKRVLDPLPPDQARQERIADLERQLEELRVENERLAAFQTSLFQETDNMNAAYEDVSKKYQRLKHVFEEKERRNVRLQDDVMRIKAAEKIQLEKVNAIERKAATFDNMRRQNEEALKSLNIQVHFSSEKYQQAVLEKNQAQERLQEELRSLHQTQRELQETIGKLQMADERAKAMTKRAEELGTEHEAVEAERYRLSEQVTAINRRLEKTQSQLQRELVSSSSSSATASGHGTGGGVDESMRKILNCSVCNVRWKDCILTKCYHMFCMECVQDNLKVRSRKCPACGRAYGADDVRRIYLT